MIVTELRSYLSDFLRYCSAHENEQERAAFLKGRADKLRALVDARGRDDEIIDSINDLRKRAGLEPVSARNRAAVAAAKAGKAKILYALAEGEDPQKLIAKRVQETRRSAKHRAEKVEPGLVRKRVQYEDKKKDEVQNEERRMTKKGKEKHGEG